MKAADLRNMTESELQSHQETLVDELVNLRVKLSMRQLDNPLRVRALRKDIARVMTIIRQKQGAGSAKVKKCPIRTRKRRADPRRARRSWVSSRATR
jgi:large subunit ribosomal protein L29